MAPRLKAADLIISFSGCNRRGLLHSSCIINIIFRLETEWQTERCYTEHLPSSVHSPTHPPTEAAAYDVMFLLLVEQPPSPLSFFFFSTSNIPSPPLSAAAALASGDSGGCMCAAPVQLHLLASLGNPAEHPFSSVTTRSRAAPTEDRKTLSSAD